MHQLEVSLFIQLSLAWGLAGLFWPERMKPLFEVLMFPWPSSYRTLRINSIAAVALSALLFFSLITGR
jgi:hypothetical protein